VPVVGARSIVFPVAAKVTYSDTFGNGRSGGRSHEGQDLMGAKGTPLIAAVDGTITSVRHSSDGLSGNMLRITDAEGWQYVYIHINNDRPGTDDAANIFEQAFVDGVRQGQKVKAGEPVAYLGDSGNAEGTGAHLHFEIRTPDNVAVNAYSSLRAATVRRVGVDERAGAAPVGAIDSLSAVGSNSVRVQGWALDRVVNDPVAVTVYVDGNPLGRRSTTIADGDRPDIDAAFPGRGAEHGFDLEVTGIVSGQHRICVILHNAGDGGGSTRLGCSDVWVS